MEDGVYAVPRSWEAWLPEGVRQLQSPGKAEERFWRILTLTPDVFSQIRDRSLRCRCLLMPGEWERLPRMEAEHIITYGLSPRDTLTLSSLETPVLCIQRTLPGICGSEIEPQEIPLPRFSVPAESLLALLGLRLLRIPLMDGLFRDMVEKT